MIEWYYCDAHCQEVGPLSAAEFEVCVAVGEIQPETPVWRSGLVDWTTFAALRADARGASILCSRQAASARWDSSYRTQIALGASQQHRRPAEARLTTSGCTPQGAPDLGGVGKMLAAEPAAPTAKHALLCPVGVDLTWLGRQFMRLALAGLTIGLMHFLFVQKAGRRAASAPQFEAAPVAVER